MGTMVATRYRKPITFPIPQPRAAALRTGPLPRSGTKGFARGWRRPPDRDCDE